MKITGRPTLSANNPDMVPKTGPSPPPQPDLLPSRASYKLLRRRTRLRRAGAPTGKRNSRPQTPLLRWKTDEVEKNVISVDDDEKEVPKPEDRRRRRRNEDPISVRKLGAVLWRLNLPEPRAPDRGGGGLPRRRGEETGAMQVGIPFLGQNNQIFGSEAKDSALCCTSMSGKGNGLLYMLEPAFQFSNSAMESATKWDPILLKPSEEAPKLYAHGKLLDMQAGAESLIFSLRTELKQAQAHVLELEAERQTSKKKLEHILKKVKEEKAAWRRREHEKIRAYMDDIKSELNRERKSRKRMEIVNSKLVDELAEVKLSAKRYIQYCEKERKTREMMEEVCNELVKEMEEDKAELEALKEESLKFRDEADEERKMLQMAEVWREERVRMKLVDAKVALEEKYSEMNHLVANLQNFLWKLREYDPDMKELKEAEILQGAAASVNIQQIKDFTYEPSSPDDIFAVLEEVNRAENNEMNTSKIHKLNPEASLTADQKRHSNAFLLHNRDNVKDCESEWETVSDHMNEGSVDAPERSRSAPSSVIKNQTDSNVSASGSETSATEISEVSAPAKQLKKASSIAMLWRLYPNIGGGLKYKLVPMEGMNHGRLSNARIPNGVALSSPDNGFVKGGSKNPVGDPSSPETCSPNIMPATNGCIEWSRGTQKNSLKAKLGEARIRSHRVQLRQVLKQKM
ncbi:hypothetical protein SAY87_003177 [Trapa incisa]|uniref:Uncharacterized protein n=1 Tax=Trapa incisa TaxID=236973 RepID=A0AAN7KQD8_9MYRT|nr:hypothetical protein SAY87_003177 [Trapa incisa]